MNWQEAAWSIGRNQHLFHSRKGTKYGQIPETWKQFITRKWSLNEKDPFPLPMCWDRLLTDWNFWHLGKSMTSSTPGYYDRTRKTRSMERTLQNHLPIWSKVKRYMKLKPFSIIEKEDEDTNTLSNGGDILSPMRHGNQNIHFPTMVTP